MDDGDLDDARMTQDPELDARVVALLASESVWWEAPDVWVEVEAALHAEPPLAGDG